MRRLAWRIPNVALAHPVELAEEQRIAPVKRRGVFAPPLGATLGDVEYLTGPDGSRWRVEMVSESEAIADEM